jgi:D-tyrosyl-tRNA(Tyr) deacylase
VENGETRSIGRGLLILLAVAPGDSVSDAERLGEKVLSLRLFPARWAFEKSEPPKTVLQETLADKKPGAEFDLSVSDIRGDVLVVSQFTLLADTKKGRRPDFAGAAKPEAAVKVYRAFIKSIEERLLASADDPVPVVAEGVFGASMRVTCVNEGPVTVLLDTAESKGA